MGVKPAEAKAIIEDVKKRGWVQKGNKFYTPAEVVSFNIKPDKPKRQAKAHRTGWIDDELNLRNKAKSVDVFMALVKAELSLDVWPEFYISTDKNYRLDYAIPVNTKMLSLKIAIEVNGGIWKKGDSGHSSGTGIKRDMDKSNLAQSLGWKIISVEPRELLTTKTLNLIRDYAKTHSLQVDGDSEINQ